MDVD